jgi:hypothetical protein
MLSPPTPATLAALDRAFVTSGPDAPPATLDLLMSVLEYAELALVVADATGRAMYMNASARSFLDSPLAVMPAGWPRRWRRCARRSSATARPSSASSTAS